MEVISLLRSLPVIILLLSSVRHSSASPPLLATGIHPLDEKYYEAELIKCKDGSKSFTRDKLNDDFCDCPDGTDEPGTSACPSGKFYCRNIGSTPKFLFSSRVNDGICDCCDGSDEYDGTVVCHNTCIMGGNFVYQTTNYRSTIGHPRIKKFNGELGLSTEDSLQKLRGLKVLVILQVLLISTIVGFCLIRQRIRSKRRSAR